MLYATLTDLLNQKRSLEYLSLTVFWPDAKGHAMTPNTLITDLARCWKCKPCNTSSFDAKLLRPIQFNWFEVEKSTLDQVQLLLWCVTAYLPWCEWDAQSDNFDSLHKRPTERNRRDARKLTGIFHLVYFFNNLFGMGMCSPAESTMIEFLKFKEEFLTSTSFYLKFVRLSNVITQFVTIKTWMLCTRFFEV